MNYLVARTAAQTLQALVPVAAAALWFRVTGRRRLGLAVQAGLIAAIPATVVAGQLFSRAAQQARWEATLATTTLVAAIGFAVAVRTGRRRSAEGVPESQAWLWIVVAATTTIVVVRQTMEIFTVVAATGFDLQGPTRRVLEGVALGGGIALTCLGAGRRIQQGALLAGIRAFSALFVLQIALYAFHESAEARLLPWSDALHAATEPYGPDSEFGQNLNYVLVVLSAGAAAVRAMSGWPRIRRFVVPTGAVGAFAAAVLVLLALRAPREKTSGAASPGGGEGLPAHGTAVVALSSQPHILFLHSRLDPDYGKVGVALLDAPDGLRAAGDLSCERVAFGGDRGICLAADPGVQTTFRGVVFDRVLKPVATFPLDGSPSRTRVSADGRVGAATVFLMGPGKSHGYASTRFSTKTILIDMATGRTIADLEQFTARRNGKRFHAADFNYWGVTFARDSNVFYATLQTAGVPFLVRGDIAQRTVTVLRSDVECPSLSPDNRTIVFKKRVNARLNGWRLHALDLATFTERPLAAATTYVDDQVEWLDAGHVLYGMPHMASGDVFAAPIDGSDAVRLVVHDALSPIVVR
jgi:hypothetical protein